MTAWRRALRRSTIGRCFVAGALGGRLLWFVGPGSILETLTQGDESLLAAAFASIVAYSAVRAWTWQQLMLGLGIQRSTSLQDVLGCYAAGALLGTVLPSTAGTDAVRAVLAQRRFGGPLPAHLAAIVVLNAVSWLAACTLGLAALAVLGGDRLLVLVAVSLFSGVIVAIVAAHSLLRYRRAWWLSLLRRVPAPLRRGRRPLRRFAGCLLLFERAEVRFGPVFATSLLAQLGVATMLWLTGAGRV